MTLKLIKSLILAGSATALTTMAGLAMPVLKSSVTVEHGIVTVGDMFNDAGPWAEEPLFRAPQPGTVGTVSLAAIEQAVRRAGLSDFDPAGLATIRVERSGIAVDVERITRLIAGELRKGGQIGVGSELTLTLDNPLERFYADLSGEPVVVSEFRRFEANDRFSARLLIAGQPAPVTISGRFTEMVAIPHLAENLDRGDIVSAGDIEYKLVPARLAQQYADLTSADFEGQAVRRSIRAGSILRPVDVVEPTIVKRNELITLFYQTGALNLSLRAKALSDGAVGDTVPVLNPMSNKIIHGVVTEGGKILVTNAPTRVADAS
ncbi:flagellar basal body P-ring formation chaperone FlgA [Cucumibacter marinus]|uniref:flagellar basal body P-ring formation chaperone FlgA n=1 Tax=Cucumibacter marinus TaxID=1121252 RepID=UPI0004264507|nr:flagellar basal body P-ring formation chaperone FlgA [Cucumibacter marinus]